MRMRQFFPGDEFLQHADTIKLCLHRCDGKTTAIDFTVEGQLGLTDETERDSELSDERDGDAHTVAARLLAALLEQST
jgi:hypothetical protein